MVNSAQSLAILDGIGGPEMVLIFVLSLMLFGGKRLPELARAFGKSMREFKRAASGVENEIRRAIDVEAPPPGRTAPVHPPRKIQPITDPSETPAPTPAPPADSTGETTTKSGAGESPATEASNDPASKPENPNP